MISEPIVFAVTSDIAGQVRGKGFPLKERDGRLVKGIGWVPTNLQITCFNHIADSPFGSVGDLLLIPDEAAEVCVDFGDGTAAERFILGDLKTLDGEPWQFCTRQMLRSALDELLEKFGLQLKVAFEHEFWISNANDDTWIAFGSQTFREHREFAERIVGAIRAAGAEPDSALVEWGSSQFEVTVSPAIGLRAADECIIVREMVRAVAFRMDRTVSFSPSIRDDVGNGLHIHISLLDKDGVPATHQPGAALDMTEPAGQFFAGVRKYMPAITALIAPSVVSYERLRPHRWSAAFNNIAIKDREAALRVCPVAEIGGLDRDSQFNVEYRAADAAASPYIQLAAIVRAGLQGLMDQLPTPEPTNVDLSTLSKDELRELDVQELPQDLAAALNCMSDEAAIHNWFSTDFVDIYKAHKLAEIQFVENLRSVDIRTRYSKVY